MIRSEMLEQLEQVDVWDIVVIGGGATGLGITLEAATRGYKTLLIEQADFAKSTSGKSTKLVHGGVRYLAQGHIALVHEASIERALLCRNAQHLVKNQIFIIPVYNKWEAFKYTIGLKLYDWMAGRLSLGSSHFIPLHETLERLPQIRQEELAGGVLYHDGQFDDARLAINLAQTIYENGGVVINYVKAEELVKDVNNSISGLVISDVESKKVHKIKTKAVVNATGVFVDDILKLDDPAAEKLISVSQGVHLVLHKKFFTSSDAMMIPKTADGRVLFLIPWHGRLLIGTTDTPVEESLLEPVALEKEIQFILETVSAYLTEKPSRQDVLSVFAGLRPLAAPEKEKQKTKEISRSHKIIVSSSGLFTILGGKWTTFRKMGEDMIDRVEKTFKWQRTKSRTAEMPIHGSVENVAWNDPLYFYGTDRSSVERLIKENTNGWISQLLNIHSAQVIWAVKHEMARTVEDVLARRTRALLLDAKESVRIAPAVANVMAEVLQKDHTWIDQQLTDYASLAKNYILS